MIQKKRRQTWVPKMQDEGGRISAQDSGRFGKTTPVPGENYFRATFDDIFRATFDDIKGTINRPVAVEAFASMRITETIRNNVPWCNLTR